MSLTPEELRAAKASGLCAKEAEAMKVEADENIRTTFKTAHSNARDRILAERDHDYEAPRAHSRFDHS